MDYVTIAEAVALTGKSISTIRRLVKRLADEGQTELVKKEQTAQGDRYLIRSDILYREFGMEVPSDSHAEAPVNSQLDGHEQLVVVLREQLQKKDEQITQLLERQRETNILMNNYQQRLLTVAPAEPDVDLQRSNLQPVTPKQSSSWVWLVVGILILIAIILYTAYKNGLLTFPPFG